jgi:hypothetical protein
MGALPIHAAHRHIRAAVELLISLCLFAATSSVAALALYMILDTLNLHFSTSELYMILYTLYMNFSTYVLAVGTLFLAGVMSAVHATVIMRWEAPPPKSSRAEDWAANFLLHFCTTAVLLAGWKSCEWLGLCPKPVRVEVVVLGVSALTGAAQRWLTHLIRISIHYLP